MCCNGMQAVRTRRRQGQWGSNSRRASRSTSPSAHWAWSSVASHTPPGALLSMCRIETPVSHGCSRYRCCALSLMHPLPIAVLINLSDSVLFFCLFFGWESYSLFVEHTKRKNHKGNVLSNSVHVAQSRATGSPCMMRNNVTVGHLMALLLCFFPHAANDCHTSV